MEELIAKLVKAGIDETTAKTLAAQASRTKRKSQTKKGGNSVYKEVYIDVTTVCDFCGHTITEKKIIKTRKPDDAVAQTVYVRMCEHCVDLLESLPKNEIINFIFVQNNKNISLRKLGIKEQLKAARIYTPKQLLTMDIPS